MSLNKFTDTKSGIDLKLSIGCDEFECNKFKTGSYNVINKKTDLPAAISGIITLLPNNTYFINSSIDLSGDRLQGSSNTTILGASSENSFITSTGLGVGIPLFSTQFTTPMRHFSFSNVDTCLNISGIGTVALDWTGVNFVNIPNIGVIENSTNWIYSKGAFLNSNGLIFRGSIDTVAVDNSLFSGDGSVTPIITLEATLTINRRFRIIYSSFVVFGATIGVDYVAGVIIPFESFILDNVNFSGGGNYVNGISNASNFALFTLNIGIENTFVNAQLYMQNNPTDTIIADTVTFVKVLGTTIPSVDNSKYISTDNRLTNDTAIIRKYKIYANISFNSGNNQVCEFGFFDSKLGTVRTPSLTKSTSNSGGRSENIAFSCVVNHQQGDYIEVHCRNLSAVTNINVDALNLVITQL